MSDAVRDTQLLTQNLRLLGVERVARGSAQDVFFGAPAQISHNMQAGRAETRIAIYPINTQSDDHLARGLTILLAALLEVSTNCEVYRILTPDLDLPALGETARLTGHFETSGNNCTLQLYAHIPFGSQKHSWETKSSKIPDLITCLPTLAQTIANDLHYEAQTKDTSDLPSEVGNNQPLATGLEVCWEYEYEFYIGLSGNKWNETTFQTHLEPLLEVASNGLDPFASWLAQHCLVRSLLPGSPCVEIAAAHLTEILAVFPPNGRFVANALRNLALSGAREKALEQLEELSKKKQPSIFILRALANEYARAFRFQDACMVYQDAIGAGNDLSELALDYARLLLQLNESEQVVTHLPLIGITSAPLETNDVLHEASAAYHIELRTRPENHTAKVERLLLLLDLDLAGFWDGFADLANAPAAIEELRTLILELQSYEGDLSVGRQILLSACAQFPKDMGLRCAFAEYLLLMNDHSSALVELQKAKSLISMQKLDDIIAVERLLLEANDDEFELRLGEVTTEVRSGSIRESDLEFLEDSLEAAPNELRLYSLLAAGYQIQHDLISALEVLLEAREQLGDEAALLHQLSVLTWQMGEDEMAVRFLEDGLRAHPLYVPLLTQIAHFHLLQGKEALAKKYIIRAESLDAEHPSMQQLKAYIAREMND